MYEIGTITYSVPPIYKLKKGDQGAHDIFLGWGALAYGPLLFQKGGIFPTTNKTLKVHLYHLIFHIKHSSGVHADRNGTQEVKSFNKPCGHEPYWRLCYY